MKEQERAKKKKSHGEKKYDGDKMALRSAQGRGQMTAHKKRKHINREKDAILAKLQANQLPEIILPKFSLGTTDIQGRQWPGKSTLFKAIQKESSVKISGNWYLPKVEEIGYLDQHYNTLTPSKTVLETIQDTMPASSHAEIRCHLNDFLFRKNEEANAQVTTLSGGEKPASVYAKLQRKHPGCFF